MACYVIIGCGPAGCSAAEAIREADSDARIIVLSHERNRCLARPRLREYATGQIEEQELETKDAAWADEQKLDVRLSTAVTGVDVEAHEVQLDGGAALGYDKLLVATGIMPRAVPFEGKDLGGVVNMHHLPEADAVRAAAEKASRAVVIGGGLLGQDMSISLCQVGKQVVNLVREPFVGWIQFDEHAGRMFGEAMEGLGIDLRLETETARLEGAGGRVTAVITGNGERIGCDMVFVAIGAVPKIDFLQGTSIRTERGLVVDDHLATSAADVYAAGSCAEVHVGRRVLIQASWGNALAQGKAAGRNMAGGDERYEVPSDYTTKVGDRRFTLFGAPRAAYPDAAFVGFDGGDGDYAALLADGGVVRGGVLVGRHKKARAIKALQMRDEPVPGLADLRGTVDRSIDDFITEALGE